MESTPVRRLATARRSAIGAGQRQCHLCAHQGGSCWSPFGGVGLRIISRVGESRRVHWSYTDEASCTARRIALGRSAAVQSTCYTKAAAAGLLSALFDCASVAVSAKAYACIGVFSEEASCDSEVDCTWCRPAAEPSMCYCKEDAASLRSAVAPRNPLQCLCDMRGGRV